MVNYGDKFLVIKDSHLHLKAQINFGTVITITSIEADNFQCYQTDPNGDINKAYFDTNSKYYSCLKLGNVGILLYE